MTMADQQTKIPPLSPSSPFVRASSPEVDENALPRHPSTAFKELKESKAELLERVQSLRKDLREWRGRLDNQVQSYRQELGELRSTLNVEVEQLKTEFQDLRVSLKKQLDVTAKLSELIPPKTQSPQKSNSGEGSDGNQQSPKCSSVGCEMMAKEIEGEHMSLSSPSSSSGNVSDSDNSDR